jgi:hypothetical protein
VNRLLIIGAAAVAFMLVGADSCSGGGGTGGQPAPQASSITGTIDPATSTVGDPVTMTFDLSGFNEAIPNLSVETSGDLADHHTIDGVTVALDGGTPTDCMRDPNKSSAYTCGPVGKTQKAEVVISATPKDAGNLSPNVLWTTGIVGADGWQEFGGDNSVMGFQETVNAA